MPNFTSFEKRVLLAGFVAACLLGIYTCYVTIGRAFDMEVEQMRVGILQPCVDSGRDLDACAKELDKSIENRSDKDILFYLLQWINVVSLGFLDGFIVVIVPFAIVFFLVRWRMRRSPG